MTEDKNELGEEKKESDEHEKQSGSEKSSLKKSIFCSWQLYWIIGCGLVLWWLDETLAFMWDEVQTWFN